MTRTQRSLTWGMVLAGWIYACSDSGGDAADGGEGASGEDGGSAGQPSSGSGGAGAPAAGRPSDGGAGTENVAGSDATSGTAGAPAAGAGGDGGASTGGDGGASIGGDGGASIGGDGGASIGGDGGDPGCVAGELVKRCVTLGTACDVTADCPAGSYCSAGECLSGPGVGQPCGPNKLCAKNAYCKSYDPETGEATPELCSPAAQQGDACVTDCCNVPCAEGLSCIHDQFAEPNAYSHCRGPGWEGAACNTSLDCGPDLYCFPEDLLCAPRGGEGNFCWPAGAHEPCKAGLVCGVPPGGDFEVCMIDPVVPVTGALGERCEQKTCGSGLVCVTRPACQT
jgi:hypothetical protein